MDITRNQYFLAGLVLLFLGIEMLFGGKLYLTPEFTQFLAERTGHKMAVVNDTVQTMFQTETDDHSAQNRQYRPSGSAGRSSSLGSVLILHSWAMKKPGT